jgi:hypothetical protein
MEDDSYLKVMLPIIRRVVPNIIATDIVGVQPRSSTRITGTEQLKPYDLSEKNDTN